MSSELLVAISSMFGASVSAVSAIIIAKINRDKKKEREEAEKMNKLLEALTGEVKAGNKVSVATARSEIASAYDKNKQRREIEQGIWESVSDLYDAYKGIKIDGHTPNSWCDSMVNEMKDWKKV